MVEDCVAGGDCSFCLCAHRLAPRLLVRAFDSVLEARGLRCGARAAFPTLASRNLRGPLWLLPQLELREGPAMSPIEFDVFLARTRQEVFSGHFESYTTKERRLVVPSSKSNWQPECHRPHRKGMNARSVEVAVASMESGPEISISEAAPRAPRLGYAREGSRQVEDHY